MVVYGYAKQCRYDDSGALQIQVRVPVIHGPYVQYGHNGRTLRNYVRDADLPWYPSLLLTALPSDGDVVALIPTDDGKSEFLVLGRMGSSYSNTKILEG